MPHINTFVFETHTSKVLGLIYITVCTLEEEKKSNRKVAIFFGRFFRISFFVSKLSNSPFLPILKRQVRKIYNIFLKRGGKQHNYLLSNLADVRVSFWFTNKELEQGMLALNMRY